MSQAQIEIKTLFTPDPTRAFADYSKAVAQFCKTAQDGLARVNRLFQAAASANPAGSGQGGPGKTISTWQGEFNRVITGLEAGWKGWSAGMADAFSSVFEKAVGTILNSVINAFVEMGVRYVSTKLLMSATDSLIAEKTQSENAATTASGIPAGMSQAGAQGGWYGLAAYIALFVGGLAALTALTSNARESGGPVLAGLPYVVGEKRPELFVPGQDGHILPSVPAALDLDRSSSSFSSSSSTNIHFAGVMDSEALAIKGLSGKRGRKFLLDFNKGTVREVHGRG